MRNKIVLPLVVVLIALFAPVCLMAQSDPGGLPAVNDVPIDGGLSVLLAAGVGYGIKKVRDGRKEKKETDLLSK